MGLSGYSEGRISWYFVTLTNALLSLQKFVILLQSALKDKVIVDTLTSLSKSLTPVKSLVGKSLSFCLLIYLSYRHACPYLSGSLSICPSICWSVYPSERLLVCLLVYPSVRLFVCLLVCPSVRLFICLLVCPSIHPHVCLLLVGLSIVDFQCSRS